MIGPMFSTVYFDMKKLKEIRKKQVASENIKLLDSTYQEVKRNNLKNKSPLHLILYSMIKINNKD